MLEHTFVPVMDSFSLLKKSSASLLRVLCYFILMLHKKKKKKKKKKHYKELWCCSSQIKTFSSQISVLFDFIHLVQFFVRNLYFSANKADVRAIDVIFYNLIKINKSTMFNINLSGFFLFSDIFELSKETKSIKNS